MSDSDFQALVNKAVSRRALLSTSAKFGLTAFVTGGVLSLASCGTSRSRSVIEKSIPTSTEDTISLDPAFDWYPVISWGDPLFSQAGEFDQDNRAALQNSRFGDNNDGMALMAVGDTLVLVVNNEYINVNKMFPNGVNSLAEATRAKAGYGVSVVEVEKTNNGWKPVIDGKLNRRITMETPMEIRGPARGHPFMRTKADPLGISSLGTWSNCGSGTTPWGTYLTCEENFNLSFHTDDADFVSTAAEYRYEIGNHAKYGQIVDFYKYDERFDLSKERNEPNRMGYVVEIDPSDPHSVPIKRTALGRMMHENAEVVISKEGFVVVYMGDDSKGEYLYKYVSNDTYIQGDKENNSRLLDDGKLYVARFDDAKNDLSGRGQWLELSYGLNGLTIENGFASQAEVCIETRMAASTAGGTTMDRPEWVAVHPNKIEVACALTNNTNRGIKPNLGGDPTPVNGPNPREQNLYGQIVRWYPDDEDHASLSFEWELFVLAGNPLIHQGAKAGSRNVTRDNMFNSPDGIEYDSQGRLWIQTDGKFTNKDDFAGMGNNQMLVADSISGEISRFMVGPNGCEITGLSWSPDRATLFVGIQHPGSDGTDSSFPDGNGKVPRSTVVAIERKDKAPFG